MVAFRGTNGADLENWITNIKAASSPYPGVVNAEVHTGFQQAYNDVKAQVNNAVKNLMAVHTTAKVFVTGHSLGGALATFAGVDVKEQTGTTNAVSMYTFGSPRTGNQAFTDHVLLFSAQMVTNV